MYVTVPAESREDARLRGEEPAKARAEELILRERSISSRMGAYGRGEIKKLIEQEGRIVKVHAEPDGSYVVVMQIYRRGLHKYLQSLY